jgi:DNA-binding transcriptional regulator YiaG
MADLAGELKEQIRRLARKEIRAATGSSKQSVARYDREIASLKRQLREQEKKIAFLEDRERNRLERPEAAEIAVENARFSARSVKAQRDRLGLSAADYALLVGVPLPTLYNWEKGKTRPRQEQLAALVAVCGIGKREAARRLDLLKGEEAGKRSGVTGDAAGDSGKARGNGWNETKNARRCELIDKEIVGSLSVAEQAELNQLQAEMLDHRRRVAPLPLDDLRELHRQLMEKAEQEGGG